MKFDLRIPKAENFFQVAYYINFLIEFGVVIIAVIYFKKEELLNLFTLVKVMGVLFGSILFCLFVVIVGFLADRRFHSYARKRKQRY